MKTKIKYLFTFLLILFFIIFLRTAFNQFVSQEISASLLLYSIGKLAGLIGFLFLSALIISGDTARFFDRFFGMDKIIKFQRKFALITAIFVLAHPLFFILSDGNYSNYLIPDFAVLPLALGIVSLYIFIIAMAASALYKRIPYNAWQYIHALTYLLFFFSLYHVLNIGSDAGNIFVKSIIGILLMGVIAGAIYRASYKIKRREFKYLVKEINWETQYVFTLRLKCDKKMFFKPGQFCFLRLNKGGLYARHPFTISSSPNEDTLNFTMKITGRFTRIASQLKEGEEVIVDGPFGVFTIKDKRKNLVFIAGGVGIAPFISMIRNQLETKEKQSILLLYGARTSKDIIFKVKLDDIEEDWFKKVYVLSEDPSCIPICEKGFIDKEIIKKQVKNFKNSLFYICGPEPMKEMCTKELVATGVGKKNIIIESFFW